MEKLISEIKTITPDIDEQKIRAFLESADQEYRDSAVTERIVEHFQAVESITDTNPLRLLFRNTDDITEITVITMNFDSIFSIICGTLSAKGLSVISGSCHTLADNTPGRKRSLSCRKIIDIFHVPEIRQKNVKDGLFESLEQAVHLIIDNPAGGTEKACAMVREMAARRLLSVSMPVNRLLLPIDIEVRELENNLLRFTVRSEDTPFFLYSLSSAMSSSGISIEQVDIETENSMITDTFIFRVPEYNKISIADIKLYILLTKQFTYFLTNAPDPASAYERFENILKDILEQTDKRGITEYIKRPFILKELATILGTSQYLWEDFIRGQYEELIPLLSERGENEHFRYSDEPPADIRLEKILSGCTGEQDFIEKLNRFKDEEIFLMDLDHILNPDSDFRLLSRRLTRLAEAVCSAAAGECWRILSEKYGCPRIVTGEICPYGVFGLGKMGGEALGYASDIELLFIYSDNGYTDGAKPISNSRFFEDLVKKFLAMINAKREGIFSIDLRLRPWGKNSPLACSLEHFCSYYGPGGEAHSLEILSLVRLRGFSGSPGFIREIEQLRNDYLYSEGSIDLAELREARKIQLGQKQKVESINAKFSVGGLVDLEYAVQILQIEQGRKYPGLRTPSIHSALDEFVGIKLLERDEADGIIQAYQFLRKLINSLRMLRGSALDLYLPDTSSREFFHLAGRMGYRPLGDLTPENQLLVDFQTITARVRLFAEKRLGRNSLPPTDKRNIADLVLSESVSKEKIAGILKRSGLQNASRAFTNIRQMAGTGNQSKAFARVAVLAFRLLGETADPDMSLNNWERFTQNIQNPEDHYRKLLQQPMVLQIMLKIFAFSQYLSDILISRPNYFNWLMNRKILLSERTEAEMSEDLKYIEQSSQSDEDWLLEIRKFKKLEMLRISARDICNAADFNIITSEISALARAVINASLKRLWRREHPEGDCPIIILAFGKLGGGELNYSSDIDLAAIHIRESLSEKEERQYRKIIEQLGQTLSSHTDEGFAYRVDFRLRPFGSSGALVFSLNQLKDYYEKNASLWEFQAALRISPITGSPDEKEKVNNVIRDILSKPVDRDALIESSHINLLAAVERTVQKTHEGLNIKTGPGGIRFIEFLVQPLQLALASKDPRYICGNTLKSISLLSDLSIIDKTEAATMSENYIRLRKLEHVLQLFEDRQTHSLPSGEESLQAIARRAGEKSPEALLERTKVIMKENLGLYGKYIRAYRAEG